MQASKRPRNVIAHLLPWPAVGGTEHATLRIARAVREHGFESVAFCLREAEAVHALFRDEGFETVAFDPAELSLRRPAGYLSHTRRLARELRTRRVDLLHCADLSGAFFAAPAGKLAGVPVVCHVRNQCDHLARREHALLSAVDDFVFVSKATWRSFAHSVPAARGRVIYDAVHSGTERDADARSSVRRELQLPPATPIVGMAARVSPQKDYFTLARAAARVVQSIPNVRFVVVGDTENEEAHRVHHAKVKDELARLGVSDAFIFTGFRSDVSRLLQSFDVAVLSTNWEGLPLVLIESMALGVPTVATAVDGIPEVIPNPAVGLLFPPGDDAMLARHLLTLLTDGDAARRLGVAGQSFVHSAFSADAFASGLVQLYDSVLDRSHSRDRSEGIRPVQQSRRPTCCVPGPLST